MPPRVSVLSRLRALDISGASLAPSLPRASTFIPSTVNAIQTRQLSEDEKKKRRLNDPYVRAQLKAQKAARQSRSAEIALERAEALGDPIRGETTPFVESFDTALPNPPPNPFAERDTTASQSKRKGPRRNDPSRLVTAGTPDPSLPLMHNIKAEDLAEMIERAKALSFPISSVTSGDSTAEEALRREAFAYAEDHSRATRAVQRILNLANGSARDKLRSNTFRCVEEFGRHNTDKILPPKPGHKNVEHENKMRGGPDTGSSEVQIAVLTAKIRSLADALEGRGGTKDKHNKRNLRLLVHRRQKLLRYMRRKEKGGPRWQHCIEKLGLTDGTWQGEITL